MFSGARAVPQVLKRTARLVLAGLATLASLLGAAGEADAQEVRYHSFGNAIEALVISVEGEIKQGFSDRFQAFLESEAPEGYQVILNSPGGNLLEGLKLGYIIRENGYHTRVGRIVYTINESGYSLPKELSGDCSSACALAFLGGEVREVASATSLGFHQFYGGARKAAMSTATRAELHEQSQSRSQILSGLIVQYMVEMGVDARAFTAASNTQPEDMTYLSEAQAIAFNVVTPQGFGDLFIEPYRDGIVAASRRIGPTHVYDQVYQTTFYCSEGKSGFAIIMMTADGIEGMGDRMAAERPGFEARVWFTGPSGEEQKFLIPANRVTYHGGSNDIFVEIEIVRDEIRALLQAREVRVQFDAPRTWGGGYGAFHTLSEQDRLMIRSAFMHCI